MNFIELDLLRIPNSSDQGMIPTGSNFRSKERIPQSLLQKRQGSGRSSALKNSQQLKRAAYICAFVFCLQALLGTVDADPVLASSLGFCKNVPVLKGAPLHCCLPAPKRTPIRFRFPLIPRNLAGRLFLRERKPAHVVQKDPEYVRKYNLAYARMKALPDTDPRSFLNQWRVHCSFCNEAFKQRKTPGPLGPETGVPLQVHYSWTFLPWHRMYLYYHERILASLINDPTFALPFWNWDNQLDQDAAMIPAMFLPNFSVPNAALFDEFRNPNHMPPKILHLGYNSKLEAEGKQNLTDKQIRYENLCVMYNQVATNISARDFLGGPYVVGTDNSAATVNVSAGEVPGESGGMENAHNVAHEWTGLINDPNHPDNEDMGNFIYAARDPIFYSHHSNVDRLWDVWKTIPDKVTKSGSRKRMDYTSRDFLDTEFTFYDENQDMVIVKVRDSLDSSKLGYKFTDVSKSDNMWIYYEPMPPHQSSGPSNSSDYPAAAPSGYNYIGTDPVSFRLDRRAPTSEDARQSGRKNVDQLQENVVLEKVKIPHSEYARFDVFINYPAANRQTHLYMSEYVGTFTHLPSGMVDMSKSVSESSSNSDDEFRIVTIRYSVNAALKRLGITDYNTDIVVTIVSKGARNSGPKTGFTFSNLKQDFQ
ncbi:polyphenol oxidase [Marchantia polymorpha subsp. ruderalis]|uniref:Tyrosinase copper-binding domain-containing protein n=2 Tax=Marchantia polymorpha TaxID=3197 RepID=A0AAF6BT70_MARPO|nr:hypothetical protein MARPO_0237s0004 [Marchantia polymorpha]BBN15204.1 hypothetical protein Mp_6g17880 [Marchantia polymorpha subsp. ruderalis]|eukprot:PTQ27038.1 hypothetical protein MARPO_0237s0004 [Marchantia polymorpha]